MKLARVSRNGRIADAIVEDDHARIVGAWLDPDASTFALSRMSIPEIEEAASQSTETVPLAEVKLELPVDARSLFLLVGGNYPDHLEEYFEQWAKVHGPESKAPTELLEIERPVLLMRHVRSFAGPAEEMVKPTISDSFDYECELGVVIGKAGRHIPNADALDHVLGYTCVLDGSIRDHQKLSSAAGKTFWRTGAVGPWIVTADEAPDWTDMTMQTRINGEVMQSTHVKNMTFDIPALIAYCSTLIELQPGDFIVTGTPGGVGIFRDPPRWMKPGDVVEVDISGVGTLRNPVVAE